MSYVRPIPFDRHPLVEQKYILPTPSIEELYQRVKKIIRLRTPGAIIYAHPRFGKTYSIRYILRVLKMDMPGIVTFSFGCRKSKSHSEDMFFATLLRAVGHPAAESGSIARKRSRLVERVSELVERSRYNLVIAFADEAQRLDIIEYEWLRDVHDELERAGIRMITLLVGQPQLINQKNAFREARQTQIVARFMIDEMPFRGIQSPDDLATCLAGYDEACYPFSSDWTYTRFFFPYAFSDGLRLVDQTEALWDAFDAAHSEARFDFCLEIPMQYLARTVEIAFIEYAASDAADFRFSRAIWDNCVEESNYVSAQEELKLVMGDGFYEEI
ncbi:hypothetical protein CKCBHOJB_02108 [Thauera sp. GDN1]|uniref:ATP-binding protein n=1 Tax=Thauera sp. GDN1 TaxID=2944810 RepID=UPI002478AA2B|nr:ATP-binding protein [Thauera sp. GDN1]WEN42513.1 hypothetical protein CKCBHOJB_02108 [Thauera sp. GDN1]